MNWNYLKAGIGEPCAGQIIENMRLFATLKVPKVSDDVGNIGLADPIGSRKMSIVLFLELVLEL